ncbi:hypothetical protein EDD16DRAFT_1558804 [Pisolithus croceorrhizus]|nr:hypothetical protein EDD16DRAFT_1558804 [Pisolithus croceorrhizus]
MASDGVYRVTLDEAIEAMRLTATDMSVKYKETSLSGLAVSYPFASLARLAPVHQHVVSDDGQDSLNRSGLLSLRSLLVLRRS